MTSVLLVEDDPLVVTVLLEILEGHELDVVDVDSGTQALVTMASRHFDVIVSDLTMEAIDGLEVLERARRENPTAKLVLISGYADETTERRVRELGGEVLHKPFGASAFRSAVGLGR